MLTAYGVSVWLALLTSSPVAAQGFFPRGDATCSINISAADISAEVRSLRGASSCGNDDCDRDGTVAASDVSCAIGCLFGECPVPSYAPQVTGVTADSAPNVVPLSSIRITVANLGTSEHPKRVTVGGITAPVAFIDGDTLEVVVPPGLPPGPTSIVVWNGDLAGPTSLVTIAAPAPIGSPDTLDGTLDLLDQLAALLEQLPLEEGFGTDATVLHEELQLLRADLAAQRTALTTDPAFGVDARAALDAAVDASGIPELLRQRIAEVQALLAPAPGNGSGGQGTLAVRGAIAAGSATIRLAGAALAAAGAGTGVAISTPVIVTVVVIGGILAIAGGYYTGVLSRQNEQAPLIKHVIYRDGIGVRRYFPTPGGSAEVSALNADSSTSFVVSTAFGEFALTPESQGADSLTYRLPNTSGFCGATNVFLRSAGGLQSAPLSSTVQPLLQSIDADRAYPKQGVTLEVNGVAPCEPLGAFLLEGEAFKETAAELNGEHLVRTTIPDLPPAQRYLALVKVEGLPSQEDQRIEIVKTPTLTLQCTPTRLMLSPGTPSFSNCSLTVAGDVLSDAELSWISSDRSVAPVNNVDARQTTVDAKKKGSATIQALLVVEPEVIAESNKVTIKVIEALPSLQVTCDSTALFVAPATPSMTGCTVTLTPADAVLPEGAEFTWVSSDQAGASVANVDARSTTVTGLKPTSATIKANIVLDGETAVTSNEVAITVADTTAPSVTVSTSASSTVKAGGSVEVKVRAADNVQVDRIHVIASGDALSSVSPSDEVPCILQKTCTVTFTINVKDSGYTNHQVTVSAEAFDEKGNQGTGNTLTFTVKKDTECPVVAIQRPVDGGRVRAGDTVQISVRVTDDRPEDTGVKRVIVNASGPALATAPVPADVTLPMPLPQATRLTTLTVKSAAEIINLPDPRITISAQAFDDAGNTCDPQTASVTVGGPVITGLSDTQVNAGAVITISGQGFGDSQGSSSVTIGSATAAVNAWSNSSIAVTVPDNLSGPVNVTVTVAGETSNAVSLTVLGTGDVQVTLTWSDRNDLDLHVTEPSGEEIYYGHRSSATGGTLDVDANVGCGSGGQVQENIYWPSGQAPSGQYHVRVVYYLGCGDPPPASSFTVGVRIDGRFQQLLSGTVSESSPSAEASFSR